MLLDFSHLGASYLACLQEIGSGRVQLNAYNFNKALASICILINTVMYFRPFAILDLLINLEIVLMSTARTEV